MGPHAKLAATAVGVGMVAALGVPLTPAAAAPSVGGPAAGRWTEPETVARGKIVEVLAPPGYGGFYGEARFVWRKGSTLTSRYLRFGKDDLASHVTAATVSGTALVWHTSQGPAEGVHLSVFRPIGSSGGDPGWAQSSPALVPNAQDPAATPDLAVADEPYASTSAVVYSRTTAEGTQLEAVPFSTGGRDFTNVALGETQVLTTTHDSLDELEAVHGQKLIAVAYRLTAADGATSVVLRTSPVADTANQLIWGPELVVCQAPADAVAKCDAPTFGRDKAKNVHLFLRAPDGLQHRTVSAAGASEAVLLGPATGPLEVMDAGYFYDAGRDNSYKVNLSVAAAHGDRTTVWRIRRSRPAVGTTVLTPGVRMLALGQHGAGRMLAWSNGTGIGTWSDDRRTAVKRVASDVSRVTQLGMLGGLAPRIWYVAGATGSQRLVTTQLDEWAPVVRWWRYRVVLKPGRPKLNYNFGVSDETGLDRTVVQVRSGPAARAPGKWRTVNTISHRGKSYAEHWASLRVNRGFRYCMRIRSRDVVGRWSVWNKRGSGGESTCRTVPR